MSDTPPPPEDWTDRKAVEAWLRTQPRAVAVALAARAALRVLPLIWPPSEGMADRSREEQEKRFRARLVLPLCRALAVSWVAAAETSRGKEQGVKDAAMAARTFKGVIRGFDDAQARANHIYSFAFDYGVRDGNRAYDVATATDHAAASAADAFYSHDDAPMYTGDDDASFWSSRAALVAAPAICAAAALDAAVTDAVAIDAIALSKGTEVVARQQLWHDAMPRSVREAWTDLKAHLLSAKEGWEVWTEWYDARLRGDPVDVELETKRVILPQRWADGPATVNAEIAQIIADHIIERAPVSRDVGIRPDTGRLDAMPPTPKQAADLPAPETLLARVRRVVGRQLAQRRQDGHATQPTYGILFPAFDAMDAIIADETIAADELHFELEALDTLVSDYVDATELPDDPATTALRSVLFKSCADLEEVFPPVARMVAARSRARLRRLQEREIDLIERAFDAFEEVVEPSLLAMLGADKAAIRQTAATPDDSAPVPDGPLKTRIYRLRTYVLEIVRKTKTPVETLRKVLNKGVDAVKQAEKFQAAWEKIQPFFSELVEMLSRLG